MLLIEKVSGPTGDHVDDDGYLTRATGQGRHRMQATAQVVDALAACPNCGAPLEGGSVKRTRSA